MRKTPSKPETPLGKGLDAAYGLLARGERFRAEIQRELDRKGLGEEAEAVMARLESRGMLDEFRAARTHAVARQGKRAAGDALIRAELEARGAPAEAIGDALAACEPEVDRAHALLVAGSRSTHPPARQARFLASRGFEADTIESVLKRQNECG